MYVLQPTEVAIFKQPLTLVRTYYFAIIDRTWRVVPPQLFRPLISVEFRKKRMNGRFEMFWTQPYAILRPGHVLP